jgi:hypothetical protein
MRGIGREISAQGHAQYEINYVEKTAIDAVFRRLI